MGLTCQTVLGKTFQKMVQTAIKDDYHKQQCVMPMTTTMMTATNDDNDDDSGKA